MKQARTDDAVRTPALDVRRLRVEFDVGGGAPLVAVRDVSIDVVAGELLGLVGESGCGKSTTLLAMVGLLAGNSTISGSVKLDGTELFTEKQDVLRRNRGTGIGLVLQASMSTLNPVKSIESQLTEPLVYHKLLDASAARARAKEVLALLRLPSRVASQFPHELSGGMRQRASIAVALSAGPKVLLLDEPTTALDVIAQAQVLELIQSIAREQQVAIVLVTHDLPLVSHYCDEVAVMYAGEVVERRRTAQWDEEPRHPYTRLLLASTPDLLDADLPATISGTPPRLDALIPGCAFVDRCDCPIERCASERPILASVGDCHQVACHVVREMGERR